jgi:hypothetical protein
VKPRAEDAVEILGRSPGKQTSAELMGEDRLGERQRANRRRRGCTSRLGGHAVWERFTVGVEILAGIRIERLKTTDQRFTG